MAGKLVLAALALAAVAEGASKKATITRPLGSTLLERLESRKLQTAQYRWTTEHHDIQNTGNSGWIGPAEASGVCKTTIIKSIASDFGFLTSSFYSTGVTSVGNGWWFGGDSQNTFWFAEDFGNEQWIISSINLTNFFNVGNPATPWGVVAAPTTTLYTDGNNEVFVGSGDGNVYAMDVLQCAVLMDQSADAGVQPAPATMVPADALNARPLVSGNPALRGRTFHPRAEAAVDPAASSATGRNLQAQPGCNVWQYNSGNGLPFAAPTRLVENPYLDGRNFLLVSETNPDLATGGILHALDASTGQPLWNLPATPQGSSTQYSLAGITPALIPTANNVILMPFGNQLVAIDLQGGFICDQAYTTNGDILVSSVSISPDGTAAYAHSAGGSLWRFNINTAAGCSGATITTAWGCAYTFGVNPPVCNAPSVEVDHPTFHPATGEVLSTAKVPVRSYAEGAGGWHQPTTRAERDELYAAIERLHTARYGAEETARVKATAVHPLLPTNPDYAGFDMEPLRVARLAGQVPRDELYSIVTPSGYLRLGRDAKPALHFSLNDFGGIYPYATPAVTGDSTMVALSNFALTQDSGVMLLNAGNGSGVWGYYSFSTPQGNVAFGKSRSSPAIDSNNAVYVGSDIDWTFSPTSNMTIPALFAIDAGGNLKWVTPIGEENITVGYASPVITDGVDGDHRAYMVSKDSIISMVEGVSCPTNDPVLECSGHGHCNCGSDPVTAGKCSCYGCWYDGPGGSCATYQGSCGQGTCEDTGTCTCDNCVVNDPITGQCTTPLDCLNGGTCNSGDGSCTCPNACFTVGPDGLCSQAFDCGPSGSCTDPGTGVPQCSCTDSCYTPSGPNGQCQLAVDCGPGGQCNGGTCQCDPCWSQDGNGACTVQLNCQNNGVCDEGSGACMCTGCWALDGNGQCTVGFNCGTGGTCTDDGVPGDQPTCTCSNPCFSLGPDGTCSNGTSCGNGQCSPGGCICDPCWTTDATGACTVPLNCGNGQCDSGSGMCMCQPCWLNDPSTGSCTVQNTCSNQGTCNPGTGTCSCKDACHSGVLCSQINTCSGRGICNPMSGHCTCSPGYGPGSQCASCDGCHYGAGCGFIADHCGGNGVCTTNADGSRKGCTCNAGWSGDSCTTSSDSSAVSGNAAVAAGVAIPVTLLGAGVLGIFLFAKMSGLSFGAAAAQAPSALAKKLGFRAGYSSLSSSGSGSGGSGGGSLSAGGTGSAAPTSAFAISSTSGAGGTAAKSAASRLANLVKPDAAKSSLLGSGTTLGGKGIYGSSSYSNL